MGCGCGSFCFGLGLRFERGVCVVRHITSHHPLTPACLTHQSSRADIVSLATSHPTNPPTAAWLHDAPIFMFLAKKREMIMVLTMAKARQAKAFMMEREAASPALASLPQFTYGQGVGWLGGWLIAGPAID